MNAMLPLDRLSKEAELGFASHGVAADSIQLALQLDMDVDGRFGETWLCIDGDKRLHIMSATSTDTSSPRVTSTLVDQNLKRNTKHPKRNPRSQQRPSVTVCSTPTILPIWRTPTSTTS